MIQKRKRHHRLDQDPTAEVDKKTNEQFIRSQNKKGHWGTHQIEVFLIF